MSKRLIIIVILCSIIFFGSCKSNKPITIIEGVELKGEVKVSQVTYNVKPENGFISPGSYISISGFVLYEDEEGTTVYKEINNDDMNIIINNNEIVTQDANIIRIKENVLSGADLSLTIQFDTYKKNYDYIIRYSLDETLNEDEIVTNPTSYDVLVNKQRSLPSNYIPKDLVSLTVPTCLASKEVNQLRKDASKALNELFEGAKTEGFTLIARSGYRSYTTQKTLYNNSVKKNGREHANKYSALPGHSEHQTGLAIDITCNAVSNRLQVSFGKTNEGIWVRENAHKYGFIIRYPEGKQDIVGYEYEPWHLRYVGTHLATKIKESNLTMEEYFNQK